MNNCKKSSKFYFDELSVANRIYIIEEFLEHPDFWINENSLIKDSEAQAKNRVLKKIYNADKKQTFEQWVEWVITEKSKSNFVSKQC